jgi:hypothetical protein
MRLATASVLLCGIAPTMAGAQLAGDTAQQLEQVAAEGRRLGYAHGESIWHDFMECGFDPQNLLEVTPTIQLHTRWVHACSGDTIDAVFNTPAVHDDVAATFRVVIDPGDSLHLTSNGSAVSMVDIRSVSRLSNLKLTSRSATVTSARADVSVVGDTLRIRPLRSRS